jgi:hypothetical protein
MSAVIADYLETRSFGQTARKFEQHRAKMRRAMVNIGKALNVSEEEIEL